MNFHCIATTITALISVVIFPMAVSASSWSTRLTTDVLVFGGTPSGVSSALSAAREGEHVILVSEDDHLGGVLSGALMDQWDLNTRRGLKIQSGIFNEIYQNLGIVFTANEAERGLKQLLDKQPNIEIIYSSIPLYVSQSSINNNAHISEVSFLNLNHHQSMDIDAKVFIDASDAGDLTSMAGAKYTTGREDLGLDSRTQAATLMFTIMGVDWDTVLNSYRIMQDGYGGAIGLSAWGYGKILADYPSSPSFEILVKDLNLGYLGHGEVTVNAINIFDVNGLDQSRMDDEKIQAEHEAYRLVRYLRHHLSGFEHARVGIFADNLYIRETRHIIGVERLTSDEIEEGRVPRDTIGLASYPLDLHQVTREDKAVFAPIRHVYGIPFGVLIPRGFDNILIASPAISATHYAAGSARTIPTTIEEGQAAGTACALALRKHVTFLDIENNPELMIDLQNNLKEDRVTLR